jgi:hypothetical protein
MTLPKGAASRFQTLSVVVTKKLPIQVQEEIKMRRGFKNPSGPNLAFWAVFLLVTVLLLSGALWVLSFVRGTVVSAAEDEVVLNQAYINYSTAGDYVTAESNAAIQAYIAEFPQPQNAQVLTGMTTSEIWSFMTAYVAGGLKVDCTYCHNINNFAADGAEIGDDVVAEPER